MTLGSLLLRTACLSAMAVWVGGFCFYAGVVVPILHDEFDSLSGSFVTRRATDSLNLIGLATIALWWAWALLGNRLGPASWRRARIGLLGTSSIFLLSLFVMHARMDRMLDTTGLTSFYPWHRAYLIVSTAQWAANLGLIASAVRLIGAGSETDVLHSRPIEWPDGTARGRHVELPGRPASLGANRGTTAVDPDRTAYDETLHRPDPGSDAE